MQKLSVKGLAVASAILWAAAVMLVAICNLVWPGYGAAFLSGVSSIYPGYQVDGSVVSILIGTVLAFFDGLIGGAIFAWLYNRFAVQ